MSWLSARVIFDTWVLCHWILSASGGVSEALTKLLLLNPAPFPWNSNSELEQCWSVFYHAHLCCTGDQLAGKLYSYRCCTGCQTRQQLCCRIYASV